MSNQNEYAPMPFAFTIFGATFLRVAFSQKISRNDGNHEFHKYFVAVLKNIYI
jgi:hypothetical protein